jgi:hypothetical protein
MNIHVRIKEMDIRRKDWKLVKLDYGGALPDSMIWLPREMDSSMLADFINDLQELDNGHGAS